MEASGSSKTIDKRIIINFQKNVVIECFRDKNDFFDLYDNIYLFYLYNKNVIRYVYDSHYVLSIAILF